jgi:hypothetical protein
MDSIINLVKYFKSNKDQIIKNILGKNNTFMSDFMENNIIENVYNYLVDKIELLVKV